MIDISWHDQQPMPASSVSNRQTYVIGHRGAAGLAPENTMAAFEKAVALGCDGVEFDVQRTSDGHLVIFHDEDLKRTTNLDGMMRHIDLETLQKADSGSWFAEEFINTKVPTVRELFDFMRGNGLLLFIELKDPFRYVGIEQQVIDLIREYKFEDRVQIRSFHHDALHTVYELAPELAISELWFHKVPDASEVTYKTLNLLQSYCTSGVILDAHQRGQKITAWTVNDADIAQTLIAAGIDGMTTDYPDRIIPLVPTPQG